MSAAFRPLPALLGLAFLTLPAGPASAAATGDVPAAHTLFLVRHGIYEPVRGADNRTANGLNALGREQAALVAGRLAALPVRFDAVVSSEFLRAIETADVVAARLGLTATRDGQLNDAIAPSPDLAALRLEPTPGAAEQFGAAWAHYARPAAGSPRNTLLVAHSTVIRWFVCRALGTDPTLWTRMSSATASLTVILVRPDGSTRLLTYNDVSHLPPDKQVWESTSRPPWLPAPAGK